MIFPIDIDLAWLTDNSDTASGMLALARASEKRIVDFMNSFSVHKPADDVSPDGDDRIRDFFMRHGGAGASTQRQVDAGATVGWYEVYAADGYALRCEWSRTGEREEMTFTELPPTAPR